MPKQWLVERIRAAAAEGAALLPVHAAFGVRALAAGSGRTQFGQRMGPWLLDRDGLLCPGAFMIAADAALGSAVNTALADGQTVMSLSIHAQFVTLEPGAADDFTVQAEVQNLGTTSGFSAGEIVDDAGRLIARLATQCGYVPIAEPPLIAVGPVRIAEEDWTEPGSPGGLAAIAERRVGARLVDSGDGQITISAQSGPAVRNSRGVLQGGVLGLLAEQALRACLVGSSPALVRAETMELDVSYLRGLGANQPDDRPGLQVTARAEHAGRRFALARATCRDAVGRLVVSAVGSRYAG
jgi:acyl-coenzyme A thioesterase PaaI-like protein